MIDYSQSVSVMPAPIRFASSFCRIVFSEPVPELQVSSETAKRIIIRLQPAPLKSYFTVNFMVCEYSTHSMSPRRISSNRFASGPIL